MTAETIANRIQALRDAYVESLPERVEPLREAISGGFDDPASLSEAIRAVHSIAGSAATFGLRPLGDAARELEGALRAEPAERSGVLRQRLDALARELEPLNVAPLPHFVERA